MASLRMSTCVGVLALPIRGKGWAGTAISRIFMFESAQWADSNIKAVLRDEQLIWLGRGGSGGLGRWASFTSSAILPHSCNAMLRRSKACIWSSKFECSTLVHCTDPAVSAHVLFCAFVCKNAKALCALLRPVDVLHCIALLPGGCPMLLCSVHMCAKSIAPASGCPVGGSQWVLPTPLISLLPRAQSPPPQSVPILFHFFYLWSDIFPSIATRDWHSQQPF